MRNLDEPMDSLVTGDASGAVVEDFCLDLIAKKPSDFDSWASLISQAEKLYYDDEDKICSIYDSFLSEFPLCNGYWRKYAAHLIRLSAFDKIVQVFEQAVVAVTHSVDVWLDYCVFCMSVFPDPNDVRRQFKRSLSHVGRDYLCHTLWDRYIEFEFSLQNWSALAYIYIQVLRYPKKMLRDYYHRFTQLVAMFKEEMERQGTFAAEIDSVLANDLPTVYMDDEISDVIKDLLDESDNLSKTKAWRKYKLIGESLHRQSCLLDEKIHCFEDQIHRTYFHVNPLNRKELENWHQYLDFVEEQGDFDWAVKLYERCLIPCAQYTEFWIRYVQLLENYGGRELASFALDRATKTFLKSVRSIHLFNARYKEQTRDFYGARTAFPKFKGEELYPDFISTVMEQANMERRLGNYESACRIYREAIELATERKKMSMLSCIYIHYSRLTYKATNSVGAALGILADGIKQIPSCKLLLKELIKFGMMHGDPKDMNAVDSIVANALTSKESQSFSAEEKESISLFFLKFVDLCGTIGDLMKAWTRHIKLFPHSVRTASNAEPPRGVDSVEVAASKAIDLCNNVDTSTCSAGSLDEPDQSRDKNQTESRMQHRSEVSEYAHNELGNGSVPSPNKIAASMSADLSSRDIRNNDAMENTQGPTELSDTQREGDCGDENNLNSLSFGSIATTEGGKGLPNATTTMDTDCQDLEEVTRQKTEENIPIAKCELPLPNSSQDRRLSEIHVRALSDSGQSVRGNPSNDDQLLQRPQSPTGTPRSVSSYVPKSHEDPPSTFNEKFTENFEGNSESARDWHFRRRPDRYIKDPNMKNRPNRQRRSSPPRNLRSDSDHIITIQRNAAHPLAMKTQLVQNNPLPNQQPWVSTPFSAAMAYSWPAQSMQQNISFASQSQVPSQPVNQASAQMPYTVQVGNQTEQMQNQQAYDQMMQNYYYQQQVLLQQQQLPQQFQLAPDQWQQQQQQQQQYWMQLQYQQQLAQAPTQQPAQAAVQQLTQQMPIQMHLQVQAPLQMQQQAQPGNQAPLLHQQQLQQLLELQQQRKQQQQEHQQPDQQSKLQPEQEKVQMQQLPPSSSENSI